MKQEITEQRRITTQKSFEAELRDLINVHSIESQSNTPDFILSQYVNSCLEAFSVAVTRRDDFTRSEEQTDESTDHTTADHARAAQG